MLHPEFPHQEDTDYFSNPATRAKALYDITRAPEELRGVVENEAFNIYKNTKLFTSFDTISSYAVQAMNRRLVSDDAEQEAAAISLLEKAYLSGVAVALDAYVGILDPETKRYVLNCFETVDIQRGADTIEEYSAIFVEAVAERCAWLNHIPLRDYQYVLVEIGQAMFRDLSEPYRYDVEESFNYGMLMSLEYAQRLAEQPIDYDLLPVSYGQ